MTFACSSSSSASTALERRDSDDLSFGVAEYEQIATTGILFDGPHYAPPVEFRDRLDFIALGTLERMGRTPDIVGARAPSFR